MKRLFDAAVAMILLVLASPVLILAAVLIRLRLGPPIFFRQTRIGRGNVPFEILKFRTMRAAQDAAGRPLPDAQRLHGLGRALRQLSIDELPSLINVVRGDMSLVGPRPLLPEYLPLYTPAQARRHEVRPGVTGWAQVNGRNAITWEEKFALDVWYVDHSSFVLDLRILAMTLIKVIAREGVTQHGHVTAEPFRGSAKNIHIRHRNS
jgi:sugar transferase EpsL